MIVFIEITLSFGQITNLALQVQSLNSFLYILCQYNLPNIKMINQTQPDDVSLADQLLKQLEDQYIAVLSQNFTIPKQNIEPEEDPENPYQPLQFDDQDDNQSDEADFEQYQNGPKKQNHEEREPEQQHAVQDIMEQIQKIKISQTESNPEIKELIQVPPTSDEIYKNLPHKQFNIDEDKIKSFALSMDIEEPEWLKNQDLCKARIQQLFTKKPQKPFTKI